MEAETGRELVSNTDDSQWNYHQLILYRDPKIGMVYLFQGDDTSVRGAAADKTLQWEHVREHGPCTPPTHKVDSDRQTLARHLLDNVRQLVVSDRINRSYHDGWVESQIEAATQVASGALSQYLITQIVWNSGTL